MQKLKKFLPKALYMLGWLGVLMGIIRFIEGFTEGYFPSSNMLNYFSAVLGAFGAALLYMAAARVIELLEKPDSGDNEKTL